MKVTVVAKDEQIVFRIGKDLLLSLQCLKEYFPSANGLTYDYEGVTEALIIKDGQLIINEKVDTYTVHFAAGKKFL